MGNNFKNTLVKTKLSVWRARACVFLLSRKASVSPKLPGCPAWCPATHFGYLEKGVMKVNYEDGSDVTINAGESYLIPAVRRCRLNTSG